MAQPQDYVQTIQVPAKQVAEWLDPVNRRITAVAQEQSHQGGRIAILESANRHEADFQTETTDKLGAAANDLTALSRITGRVEGMLWEVREAQAAIKSSITVTACAAALSAAVSCGLWVYLAWLR